MAKKLAVKLSRDAGEVVAKIKTAARGNGVHFVGDAIQGRFHGKGIEGRYEIQEGVLSLVVEKKPVYLAWTLIEAKFKEFFAHHEARP